MALKRAIEIILESATVDIQTDIDDIKLLNLIKKAEEYNLLILFLLQLNDENRDEEQKIRGFITKHTGINNYIYLRYPFKLNILINEIKQLLQGIQTKRIQKLSPDYLHAMYKYCLQIIFHDLLRTYSLNFTYFKELLDYKRLKFWVKQIFNVNINKSKYLSEEYFNDAIYALEKKGNDLQVEHLSNELKQLELNHENKYDSLEGLKIFKEFLDNNKQLISLLNKQRNTILSMNKKNKRIFSEKAAENFWLCWGIWKEFEFMNEYEIFFRKTFYKEYFHSIATALDLEEYDILQEEFKKSNWYQVASMLENKLSFIEKQYYYLFY